MWVTDNWRMAQSRVVELFDPQIEDYKERFDFYCTAHGVAEGKQKALFLTHIGQKMYTNLKTWVNPTPFTDLTLTEIVDHLKVRTCQETVEIAKRYKYFKRLQQPSESVIESFVSWRKHATLLGICAGSVCLWTEGPTHSA